VRSGPAHRSGEEPPCGLCVPPWREEDVDDLTELVDGPEQIAPDPPDLDVGLIDVPAIPDEVLTGSGCLRELRREPLDPPVDAHVVDLDTSLRQEFLDVPVGQAEPQVPADGQGDDLGREPIARERGTRGWAGTRVSVRSHSASLSDGSEGDQCNIASEPAVERLPLDAEVPARCRDLAGHLMGETDDRPTACRPVGELLLGHRFPFVRRTRCVHELRQFPDNDQPDPVSTINPSSVKQSDQTCDGWFDHVSG
jgi:hypothetical protein